MTSNTTRKILDHYLKLDREYKDYVKSFFTHMVNGQITYKAQKSLNRAELKKLRRMRASVEKVHDEWFKAIGAFVK